MNYAVIDLGSNSMRLCCLIPRIPEFTENIAIISIVGRFLEHSRVFCFGTEEDQQIYISSADLMTRNTERRVEVACPILDSDIKQRIYGILETMLLDNSKAWEQFADGRYILRHPPAGLEINSQDIFIDQARINATNAFTQNKTSTPKASVLTFVIQIFDKIKSLFKNLFK
jgi:Polyphosphate kinase